jgi:hypothetical protein
VLQPSDVDRVADQNAQLLQSVERRARAIGIGLKNAGDDAFA